MTREDPPIRRNRPGAGAGVVSRMVVALSAALAAAALISGTFVAATAQSFDFEVVDSVGNVGYNASIAIDSAGDPHIVYYDFGNHVPKYAHRVGTTWLYESPGGGQPRSMALDPQGRPAFTFVKAETLWLAHRLESGWDFDRVDYVALGGYSSLDFDSNGNPHIAFALVTPTMYSYYRVLKYAHRVNGVWTIETVEDHFDPVNISMVLDALDTPHVAYEEGGVTRLVYRHKTTSWSKEVVDDPLGINAGASATIAIDASGNPSICYRRTTGSWNVRYARRVAANVWNLEVATPDHESTGYLDMALDSHGNPHISYDPLFGDDLRHTSSSGGAWDDQAILTEACQGHYNSIAIDAQDRIYIASYDCTRGDLVLVTSAPPAAVPTVRGGSFALGAPQPNPSRGGEAAFSFQLARAGLVSLDLFGLRGERLASRVPEWHPAGTAVVHWDPAVRAPGVYFVRLRTDAGEVAWTRWVVLR